MQREHPAIEIAVEVEEVSFNCPLAHPEGWPHTDVDNGGVARTVHVDPSGIHAVGGDSHAFWDVQVGSRESDVPPPSVTVNHRSGQREWPTKQHSSHGYLPLRQQRPDPRRRNRAIRPAVTHRFDDVDSETERLAHRGEQSRITASVTSEPEVLADRDRRGTQPQAENLDYERPWVQIAYLEKREHTEDLNTTLGEQRCSLFHRRQKVRSPVRSEELQRMRIESEGRRNKSPLPRHCRQIFHDALMSAVDPVEDTDGDRSRFSIHMPAERIALQDHVRTTSGRAVVPSPRYTARSVPWESRTRRRPTVSEPIRRPDETTRSSSEPTPTLGMNSRA